ncbi:MAG: ABC transporter ATP-binding protein [Eubacteriaceae bacterium]|nr:ABC transporter ATP-binding protein [Eubacteriaceae bacterium]
MSVILELKNVSKKLGGRKVVSDLSFTVNSGEIFGFLGPNGAGKTTTIKMIVGLLSIDEGEILIEGKSIRKNFENAMSMIGGIIENPEMYDYMSGMANLKMFAKMHGNISKERIDEIVELVGLTARINDKVKKYSLGMRQRLGLAQALLHEPKLLILDEPTNGLDPAGIKELRDTLRVLADEKGVSVLVSSHLLSEMELMCDRFLIIDKGVFTDIKSLDDIKEENSDGRRDYNFEVSDAEKTLQIINTYLSEKQKEEYDKFIRLESLNSVNEDIPGDTPADDASEGAAAVDAETEKKAKEMFLPVAVSSLSGVALQREEVADIVEILVREGVRIYGITRLVHTLEDEFLALTSERKEEAK